MDLLTRQEIRLLCCAHGHFPMNYFVFATLTGGKCPCYPVTR